MLHKGFIARGVKIQAHTYQGKPNRQVPEQEYELTQPECLAMTPRLQGKPIMHWHRGELMELGKVEAAGFDPHSGDWGVSFRLNTIGEQVVQSIGAKNLGLSLRHNPESLEPKEVSLTIQPARAGCSLVSSSDILYNEPVFGAPPAGAMDTSKDQQQQGQQEPEADMKTIGAKLAKALTPKEVAMFEAQVVGLKKRSTEAERQAAEAKKQAEEAQQRARELQAMNVGGSQVFASVVRELLGKVGSYDPDGPTAKELNQAQQEGRLGLSGAAAMEVAAAIKTVMRGPVHQPPAPPAQQQQTRAEMENLAAMQRFISAFSSDEDPSSKHHQALSSFQQQQQQPETADVKASASTHGPPMSMDQMGQLHWLQLLSQHTTQSLGTPYDHLSDRTKAQIDALYGPSGGDNPAPLKKRKGL